MFVFLMAGSFDATLAVPAAAQSNRSTQAQADFEAFLTRVDREQVELQNGRAEGFKALWSHAEDVTLSGGAGGPVDKGWPAISKRLDWVATQYSDGKTRIERLVRNVGGDLGYVVQHEHIEFRVPGDGTPSTRDYRVTMIFRREAGGWRIVHRQADSNLTKAPIR
jgi:ketosteroid isomerase-like protein